MIPDKTAAVELLRKAGCSERVVTHCLVVSDLAREMAERINKNGYYADVQLIYIGALLHDIGRSITHDIAHGVQGARLAQQYGLDAGLVRIIQSHIGAGLSEQEAISLGLPEGNYIPTTIEEKVVAHADNMVIDNTVVSLAKLKEILKKKGRDEHIIRRIADLHDEINGMFP